MPDTATRSFWAPTQLNSHACAAAPLPPSSGTFLICFFSLSFLIYSSIVFIPAELIPHGTIHSYGQSWRGRGRDRHRLHLFYLTSSSNAFRRSVPYPSTNPCLVSLATHQGTFLGSIFRLLADPKYMGWSDVP